MEEKKSRHRSDKQIIAHILILCAVVVLTATVTYSITSNRYLDDIDSQNDQIKGLQNALRSANGLPEVEE